jgi:hypothetical protein
MQEESLDSMENRNFIQSFDNLYNLKRQGKRVNKSLFIFWISYLIFKITVGFILFTGTFKEFFFIAYSFNFFASIPFRNSEIKTAEDLCDFANCHMV